MQLGLPAVTLPAKSTVLLWDEYARWIASDAIR